MTSKCAEQQLSNYINIPALLGLPSFSKSSQINVFIFKFMNKRKSGCISYCSSVPMIQIYNESPCDLLAITLKQEYKITPEIIAITIESYPQFSSEKAIPNCLDEVARIRKKIGWSLLL